MRTTELQELVREERWAIIRKFQKNYPTHKDKVEALKKMENKDIEFLCYCANQIQGCIFYSQFLKK